MGVVVAALCSVLLGAAEENLSRTYVFPSPSIAVEGEAARIALGDNPLSGAPGEPGLPVVFATLALPRGARVTAVNVTFGGETRMPLPRPLAARHDATAPGAEAIAAPAAPAAAPNTAYPERPWRLCGVFKKHGVPIAVIALHPVTCFPANLELACAQRADIAITIEREEDARAPALSFEDRADLAAAVDNPEALPAPAKPRKDGDDAAYVIICPPGYEDAFAPLAALRAAAGISAKIVTTDWIYANYPGLRPDGNEDNPTRIRNFLAAAYAEWSTRYVLLAGDADSLGAPLLPMRYLKTSLYPTRIPSDVYYGCLDGTFDANANGVYGEDGDGEDGGAVDLFFELHVGRAPVDSLAEAERFVAKTIAYERFSGPVLRQALLVGERLGQGLSEWGGDLLDHVLQGSDADGLTTAGFLDTPIGAFYAVDTLYDRSYPGNLWPPEVLIAAIQSGVHIIAHVGHGEVGGVMRLNAAAAQALTNELGFIAYSEACHAGAIDNQDPAGEILPYDCIVEEMLAAPHAAAACIANTRHGWVDPNIVGGPSHRFHRSFWDRVLGRGVLRLAEAHDASKEVCAPYAAFDAQGRWCFYSLTTFGDPLLLIKCAGSAAILSAARPYYFTTDSIDLTLIDKDLDLDPALRDRAEVAIRSERTGASARVTLDEAGTATGVFRRAIPLAPGLCPIALAPPDSFGVLYRDADTGQGAARDVALARPVVTPLAVTLPEDLTGTVVTTAAGRPVTIVPEASGGAPPYAFKIVDEDEYVVQATSPCPMGAAEPRDWHADDQYWRDNLPFPFPFYGNLYTRIAVSSNGFVDFGTVESGHHYASENSLRVHIRIAVVWRDLTTEGNSGIYYTQGEDFCGFLWRGVEDYNNQTRLDARVLLFKDGRICIWRDPPDGSLCGISAGDGVRFISLDRIPELMDARYIEFSPAGVPAGLAFDPATGTVSGPPRNPGTYHLLLDVRDAVGQQVKRSLGLAVVPNPLAIVEPREGDFLHAGDPYAFRWTSALAGGTVELRYNTDGSLTSFPFGVATGLPHAAGTCAWTIADTKSDACRLLLRAENQDVLAVSGRFAIAGPRILLDRPRSGDTWIGGQTATVAWRNLGDPGARVSLRYNTTGSAADFPHLLAAGAPNTGSFSLTVPDTPASACRLRIVSDTAPDIAAVSDVFAIVTPYFVVTSPVERACLLAGAVETVRWENLGFTGSAVTIRYNTTGDADVFPLLATPSPVPNSGLFEWTVPEGTFSSCRLSILSADRPPIAAAGPIFAIGRDCCRRIVLWTPYIDEGEEEIAGTLRALRAVRPDLEPVYSENAEPDMLAADLADAGALIVVQQEDYPEGMDFAALGHDLAPVLERFMALGGAVVVCNQERASEYFLPGTGFMEAELAGVAASAACEVVDPQDPLCRHVSPQFSGPMSTAWYRVAGPGVRTAVRRGDAAVAAVREIGFGWVVLLGFDFFQRNIDTSHLLVNAVLPPFVREGVRFVAPDGPRRLNPDETLLLTWAQKGVAADRSVLRYNLDGSATEFPHALPVVLDAGIGMHAWTPPALGPDEHYACRFKVEPEGSPDLAETLPFTIHVSLPLAIGPATLPELSLGLPYDTPVSIEGGVPPFALQVVAIPDGLFAALSGERTIRIHGLLTSGAGLKEIVVRVTDAIGDVCDATLTVSAVKRTLQLLAPVGGEYFLKGTALAVRWQKTGQLGATVTAAYNTDGGGAAFPHVIAQGWDIAQPLVWELPDADAPVVRLAITADEYPEFRSVSGPFAVSSPAIRVHAPAAYRCLEPGGAGEIAWVSVGNASGAVTVRYNTDGSETEFPLTLLEGAPDTGRVIWRAPDEPIDACRMQVCSQDGSLCGVSPGTFRVTSQCGLQGLFVGRYSSGERLLAAHDAFHALEPDLSADILTEVPDAGRLAGADALIMCPEGDSPGASPSVDGLLLRNAGIQAFLERGGALVVCGPGAQTIECLQAALLLPAGGLAADCGCSEYETVDPLHPLARELPRRFAAPPASPACLAIDAPGFWPICACDGGELAVVTHIGQGWIVLIGADLADVTPELAQLLQNALRPAAAEQGVALLTPEPGDLFNAAESIPISWVQYGLSGELVLEYNLDGGDAFPDTLARIPASSRRGTYLWQNLPIPPEGEYLRCRLRARSAASPGIVHALPEPFCIFRSLILLVDAPPEAIEATDYTATLRAAGGIPPYEFVVTGLPGGLTFAQQGEAAVIAGRLEAGQEPVEAAVVVLDSAGNEARTTFRIVVRPPRIALTAPAAGATLMCGGTVRIRWEADGNIGDAVSLAYNTDGSLTEFPFVIADAVDAAGEHAWRLPAAEIAACRVALKGRGAFGHLAAAGALFRVKPAGLCVVAPSASQCLRGGKPFTIAWDTLGNETGVVTIGCNYDGAPDDFPHTIAANIADEGRWVWRAPEEPVRAMRIAIASGDGSMRAVSPLFSIAPRCPVRGVLWIPYLDEHQGELVNTIAAITLTEHDFQWSLSRAVEPLDLAAALAGAGAFVMLEQEQAQGVDFVSLGTLLGPVIRDFVARGNTAIVLKQVGAGNALAAATGLLDVEWIGQHVDVPCQIADSLHPLAEGVPFAFSTAATTAWYRVDDPGAVVVAKSLGRGAIVVSRDIGLGRAVLIGSDYNLYTTASARVLANAVRMTPYEPRTRFVRGDVNQDAVVDIADAIALINYLYAKGPRPLCLDAADANDDAYLGSRTGIDIADVMALLGYLFVRGPALPPPFRSARVRIPLDCGIDPQVDDGLDCESYDLCK